MSNGAEHVRYRDFDRAIDPAATALDRAGMASTELVAISTRDTYRHLLLILACARRGVPTVSLIPEMAKPMASLTGAVRLLGDDAARALDLLVDAPWFAAALAAEATELAPVTIDPQALGCVQLSSGSTGEPKAVGRSWALMDRRIEHTWTRNFGYERLLSLVGPESGSLPLFLWCWARGGTAVRPVRSRHSRTLADRPPADGHARRTCPPGDAPRRAARGGHAPARPPDRHRRRPFRAKTRRSCRSQPRHPQRYLCQDLPFE
ncbi:MAG: AMP-binding protein [Pseudomonadota bacterium]